MNNQNTLLAKFILSILFVASFNSATLFAQEKKAATITKKDPKSFFSKPDLMQIGVYYYPEQWPREQWERDLKNIKKLGFEFTNFAEFA